MNDYKTLLQDIADSGKENLAKLTVAKQHIAKIRSVLPRMQTADASQPAIVIAKLNQAQANS